MSNVTTQTKSPKIAFFLCLFFGMLGFHRFYTGKYVTAILMILTLGGCGIWVLIDLGNIVCNNYQDANGNTLQFFQYPTFLKKFFMTTFSVVMGFIIYWIVIFTIAICLMSELGTVVKNQLKAIKAGSIAKAYLYNSRGYRYDTPLSEFAKMVDAYPIFKKYRSVSIVSAEDDGKTGKIEVTLRTKETDTPVKYELVKEENIWKIRSIEVGKTVRADNKATNFSISIQVGDAEFQARKPH